MVCCGGQQRRCSRLAVTFWLPIMLHSHSLSAYLPAAPEFAAAWHVPCGMLVRHAMMGLQRHTRARTGSLKAHSAAGCPVPRWDSR